MFATNRRLRAHIEYTERAISSIQDRYWELWHRHDLLLKHLGLSEHKVPEKTELRSKGGPGLTERENVA